MAALRCLRNRRRCFQPRYACCIRKAARRVRRNSEMCRPQLKTTTCFYTIQVHFLTMQQKLHHNNHGTFACNYFLRKKILSICINSRAIRTRLFADVKNSYVSYLLPTQIPRIPAENANSPLLTMYPRQNFWICIALA
jgi:hypothetical protein